MGSGDDFIREIAFRTQPDGFQSPDLNPGLASTGNPCLYSALTRIVARRLGVLDRLVPMGSLIRLLEVDYGVINRKVGSDEQNSTDEYVAACVEDQEFAIRALHNGLGFNPITWHFNNRHPGRFERAPFPKMVSLKPWFGRRLEFVAHVCWSAGYSAPAINEYYAAKKVSCGDVDTATGCIQDYLLLLKGEPKSESMREAGKVWRRRMEEHWGTNEYMRLVIAHELGKDDLAAGLRHPVASYWTEETLP